MTESLSSYQTLYFFDMNFDKARHNMVTQQVRSWDVINKSVLNAMLHIQREEFVPVAQRKMAFSDMSLPIGHDQEMMKPVVEGRMLQALDIEPHHEILEVGTGSAYMTALLSHLGHHVTSIDCIPHFTQDAASKLTEQGKQNVTLINADFFDFNNQQKFDRIVITGGLKSLPAFVFNWLKPDGKIFAIIGEQPIMEARMYDDSRAYKGIFDTCVAPLKDSRAQPNFVL